MPIRFRYDSRNLVASIVTVLKDNLLQMRLAFSLKDITQEFLQRKQFIKLIFITSIYSPSKPT